MATKTAYPFRVEPQEVDFSLRITLVALGGNILNIAGIDAHIKGFGVDALNKDNFSWVLSRIAFEFDYRPEEYVKYEIATWISDYGRMLSTRNFELTDQTGVCFGRVVSQWCMLDLSKRTAVDLRAVAESHNDAIVECPSPAEKPRKVPAPDAEPVLTHKVAYSDIDFNRHVNTMRYIEMMPSFEPRKIRDVKEALEFSMTLEQRTVDSYNEWARLCAAEDDQITHKLFQDLAKEEEEHLDMFRTEMENMLNYGEQYLALQSIAHSKEITKK